MPGPAPKPESQRRRRNAVPGTIRLPAAGRTGNVPTWPLLGRAPRLWAELWRLPQAAAWEQLQMQRIVAKYVQDSHDVATLRTVMTKTGGPPPQYAALKSRLDKLEQDLGLTPIGMQKNRWEIAPDEVAQKREEAAPDGPAEPPPARRVLRVAQ